jgi:hypothetical protein
MMKKSFITLTTFLEILERQPGANVIKLFLSVIYGFLYYVRVFVISKLFWSSLTNTVAYYENL